MKRLAAIIAIAAVLGGCGQPVDGDTKRFDAVFWEVWFFHMDDEQRRAVCWERPSEAAETYAGHFDGGYLPVEERAAHLFAIACSGLEG